MRVLPLGKVCMKAYSHRRLIAAGFTVDQITTIMEILDAETSDEDRLVRERAAEKTERSRQRMRNMRLEKKRLFAVTRTAEHLNKINGHVTPSAAPATTSYKEESKERKKGKRPSRLPSDWEAPREWLDEAVAAGLSESQAMMEACKFRDWSLSSPNGAKLDWHATWRNWFRRRVEELPKNRPVPPPASNPLLDALRATRRN